MESLASPSCSNSEKRVVLSLLLTNFLELISVVIFGSNKRFKFLTEYTQERVYIDFIAEVL